MHKILLAEDDNDMRRFLVKALQNAGFEVISYDNGLSAYQLMSIAMVIAGLTAIWLRTARPPAAWQRWNPKGQPT